MFDFNYINETECISNNLTIDDVLNILSEEEIFNLVFNCDKLDINKTFVSPFREDRRPGCVFDYAPNGELRFIDWANTDHYKNINLGNMNCFGAVQAYYKLDSLKETLEFIYDRLIKGNSIKRDHITKTKKEIRTFKNTTIDIETRKFNNKDIRFWNQYGISIDELKEDFVFPVNRYIIRKYDEKIYRPNTLCYSLGLFNENKHKLYFPYQKSLRFISNCTPDDIGMINNLPYKGKLLVLSKSYKDYRVLRNCGITSIWLQNEVTIPSKHIIENLTERFDKIVVFFDNDATGIKNSQILSNKVNTIKNISEPLWLNEELYKLKIKDPSDFYKANKNELFNFLRNKKLCPETLQFIQQ